jgi:4-amino-4-deoxy-L-arabinose transferase-like glycosyltransferase
MALITRHGLGITADSTGYLRSAHLLATAGWGAYLNQITHHFPPFYSILLGTIEALGIDAQAGARILHCMLAGITTFLVGLAILSSTTHHGHTITSSSLWAAMGGAWSIALAQSLLATYLLLLTEALFLCLLLAGYLLFARYMARPRLAWLIGAAAVFALAWLTRYVGVVLIGVSVLFCLIHPQRSWLQRLRDSGMLVLVASTPMALWMLRNMLMMGRATSRSVVWHPITPERIQQGLDTLSFWMLPFGIRLFGLDEALPGIESLLLGIVLLGAGCVVIWLYRSGHLHPVDDLTTRPLPMILFVWSISYIGFLVVSISFLDAATPLDERILLPLLATMIILIAFVLHTIFVSFPQQRILRVGVICIGLAFVAPYTIRGMLWTYQCAAHTSCFLGYQSAQWRESAVIAGLQDLPLADNTVIYTEEYFAVRFLVDTSSHQIRPLPQKAGSTTHLPNTRYTRQAEELVAALEQGRAILVDFAAAESTTHMTIADVAAATDLRVLRSYADGTIYTVANPTDSPLKAEAAP